jgi:hypothetical protein
VSDDSVTMVAKEEEASGPLGMGSSLQPSLPPERDLGWAFFSEPSFLVDDWGQECFLPCGLHM